MFFRMEDRLRRNLDLASQAAADMSGQVADMSGQAADMSGQAADSL